MQTEQAASMKLKVGVLNGRDLPSMDVRKGIDAYCVLSVDGLENEVYQTKTVMKDRNPTWNSHFEWVVPPDVRLLTIALVDQDRLTRDDLVSAPHSNWCRTVTVMRDHHGHGHGHSHWIFILEP